ncbi:cation diffusion facilitator family transporter [Aeromonas hydrophila]|nr:cation diffusion facilitator family transporter [Aeromonas hydrophila]MCS3794375.1 cation diffusion facilitator family transporter [Aeromonas hydrophila]
MKIFAGILSGSVSIISEAIHSAMDLVAALIALVAVRKSDIPPDQRHPYGHDKIENVSGVIEALLILLAAGWIIFEAVGKLITPTPIEGVGIGVLVMLFSALVNSGVSAYLYRVAKEEESVALAADALHLKADVLTSLGVAVGLLGIWIAARLGYNLYLLDPIVAICVALFILKEAIAMLKQAFQPLLDHSMNEEELAITTKVIEECCPEHGGFHDLRSRQAGRRRHIDFHLTLPKEMSIEHSHAICDRIEQGIIRHLSHAVVLIHVEPSGHG